MIKTFSLGHYNPKWEAPLAGRLSWEPSNANIMFKDRGLMSSPCEVKAGDTVLCGGDDVDFTFYPNIIR